MALAGMQTRDVGLDYGGEMVREATMFWICSEGQRIC